MSNNEPPILLDVESSKQYKKHNKTNDDTLMSGNSPYGQPSGSSTPKKNKWHKRHEPASTLNESHNHLPKIPICAKPYTPMLYTFRVPARDGNTVHGGKAQQPPFHLLLDNTIAVVWSLFAKSTTPKPLGIVQLQWALSFLDTIVNRRGEHPRDVNICINTIQEQLIELYADLVNEMQTTAKPANAKGKNKSADDADKGAPKKPAAKVDDSDMEEIVRNISFSLNYTDIVNAAQKSTTTYDVDTTKSGKSINQGQSKDELTSFLQSWKQEQIDKIQAELQRLHSIENFIGNCEKNATQANMGDKELHVLLAEKNLRNAS